MKITKIVIRIVLRIIKFFLFIPPIVSIPFIKEYDEFMGFYTSKYWFFNPLHKLGYKVTEASPISVNRIDNFHYYHSITSFRLLRLYYKLQGKVIKVYRNNVHKDKPRLGNYDIAFIEV